jgi:DNA-binding CsgD family transcriptional regulator
MQALEHREKVVSVLPLSPTEKKFLALFDQGKSYKEISLVLDCSVNTLKTHARRIVVKTIAQGLRQAAYLRRRPTRSRH